MDRRYSVGGGGKSSCSKDFNCIDKIAKILKHYCNKKFTCELWCNTSKLFTIHHSQLTKFVAFTLAETLIVMGIIGVVAALTLPNLNSLTGDKEKVAKVKKIYSNLEDAYGRATAVYGPIDEWFKNDTTDEQKNKRFGERMTEFMKVSKTCGTSVGCFNQTKPKGSVGASGFDTSVNRADKYDIILADGSSVSFIIFRYEGIITVDIDGPNKGNNEYGKDLFQFFVNYDNDGITPIGTKSDSNELCVSGHMNYCSAWVIMNENLDYLKCYDNLSWSGNHSCK